MKNIFCKKTLQFMLFSFVIVALSGCGWMYQSHNNSNTKASADISSAELMVPTFSFTNQAGQSFGSEELKGQYWLANLIFTRCPSVCGLMTPNMRNIQNTMLEKGIDIKLVSFTVDPDFDTPEVLSVYGKNNGADFEHWLFLTGYSKDEITEFAREAFQTIVMDTENDIIHGTSFFLMDGEGQVIRRYDGVSSDQSSVIADIEAVYRNAK